MPRSPLQQEHTRELVEEFWAIDMDRTLLKTDAMAMYLYELFAVPAEDRAGIDAHIAAQKGKSFDTFGYLSANYPAVFDAHYRGERYDYEAMVDRLVSVYGAGALRDELLLDGADRLLGVLEHRSIPYGILTTGEEVYQTLKCTVLRRLLARPELSVMIVHAATVADKTNFLATQYWDEARQLFRVPDEMSVRPLQARKLVVVDDKEENLATAHRNMRAIHIGTHSLDTVAASVEQGRYSVDK